MFKISSSTKIIGASNNAYMEDTNKYAYGKASTYGFNSIEVSTLSDVVGICLTQAVSPYIYKDGKRDRASVVGVGNIAILDIDSPNDIHEQLKAIVTQFNFQYAIIPTQNHLTLSKGVVYYKYRLLIPVLGVDTIDKYKAFIHWIINHYSIPDVDSASWSDARFYAPTIPLAGQVYSTYNAQEPVRERYRVPEEEVTKRISHLQLLDEHGNLSLNTEIYPSNMTNGIIQYVDDMAQYVPIDDTLESCSNVSGRELTEIYNDGKNTIESNTFNRLQEMGTVSFGEVLANMQNNSRTLCKCPTNHLHSNPDDERYAWVLKTGAGSSRLYCASDHCKKEYGEFRQIVLPNWEEFVSDRNFHSTCNRLQQIVERVESNLLTTLATYICQMKQVSHAKWYEQKAYAKGILYSEMIDKNSLYILCLLIGKEPKLAPYLIDIDLAGCVLGKLSIKQAKLLMQGGWYSYLYKEGFNALVNFAQDKTLNKANIFESISNTVMADLQFIEVTHQRDILKPSTIYNGSIQVDIGLGGRAITITNNSFDEPVHRNKKRLEKRGVLNDIERYNEVIDAFSSHWKLPYGEVLFEKLAIHDLPTLLILFSTLNMYTDGDTNQRHSATVIGAPSGIGKTSLINNLYEAGLTNDDNHSASVFGHKDLYPKSIDDMKNKLFNIGDELSPTLMKDISMPQLLTNLTRSIVTVNVKGKIDSDFTSFGKVLWGARAWDAISSGSQASELRNRLFSIMYEEEHFTNSTFLALCDKDVGDIDNIVQHRLIVIYEYLKGIIIALPMSERIAMLHRFKTAYKNKYNGMIEYSPEFNEEGAIVSSHTVRVASDKERGLAEFLKAFIKYRENIIRRPSTDGGCVYYNSLEDSAKISENLGADTRRVLAGEETMYKVSKIDLEDVLVIPRFKSLKRSSVFSEIFDKLYGIGAKSTYMRNNIPEKELKAWIMTLEAHPLEDKMGGGARGIRKIGDIGGISIDCNVKDITFYIVRVKDVELFLEKIN